MTLLYQSYSKMFRKISRLLHKALFSRFLFYLFIQYFKSIKLQQCLHQTNCTLLRILFLMWHKAYFSDY